MCRGEYGLASPAGASAFVQRIELAHCDVDRDWSCERPVLHFADGGRLLKISFGRSPAREWNEELFGSRGGKRSKCKGFSFGSRRRLLDRLNQVSVAATLPQFLTLTLPDESFCDDVGEFARRAKAWLDAFEKRLLRVCPGACGIWRIEWQARKSGRHQGKLFPHFHLLVWGVPVRSLGERSVPVHGVNASGVSVESEKWVEDVEAYVDCCDSQLTLQLLDLWSDASRGKGVLKAGDLSRAHCESITTGRVFSGSWRFVDRARTLEHCCGVFADRGADRGDLAGDMARFMSLQDWASLAWYHVVDSHNLDHAQAGVRVERVRSWGGVMAYAAKYLSKVDAEFMADIEWGRSWGIFNRAFMPWARMVELPLDADVGVRLRRVARHYLSRRLGRRVTASYGITLYCDVAQFRRLWGSVPDAPF